MPTNDGTPIKKWADSDGVKHPVDPTGHQHSTSESWLSNIYNTLLGLVNGKAPLVHTHAKSDVTGLQADLDDIRKTAYAGL